NNIFLINPNGIVVGKDGSISANKVYLSTSSVSNEDMQRFADGVNDTDKIFGLGTSLSPVIKPNMGNVINLGIIEGKSKVNLIGNKVANYDQNLNVGIIKSSSQFSVRSNLIYYALDFGIQIAGDSTGELTSSPVRQHIQNNHIVSETSDLITKDD
ncbi:TPA: hypothetical protein R5627_001677, partial [Campylobacter jejuni]|nr:hypothetical protein [Campylobacter jejuni]